MSWTISNITHDNNDGQGGADSGHDIKHSTQFRANVFHFFVILYQHGRNQKSKCDAQLDVFKIDLHSNDPIFDLRIDQPNLVAKNSNRTGWRHFIGSKPDCLSRKQQGCSINKLTDRWNAKVPYCHIRRNSKDEDLRCSGDSLSD